MSDQLALAFTARDAILAKHRRRELARWLEWECYLVSRQWGRPVSANDARAILEDHGLLPLATAFLAGVFAPSRWTEAGRIPSRSPDGHARKINQYLPRVAPQPVERPRWP